MLLSSDDLEYMRDTQETALPGTVVIQRVTLVPDGMGGSYETWAGAGTVIGRIMQRESRGGGEMVGGAQVHSHTSWWATFPVGTDVTANDRLLYNDRSWEVISVNNDAMYQTAVRAELVAHGEENRT